MKNYKTFLGGMVIGAVAVVVTGLVASCDTAHAQPGGKATPRITVVEKSPIASNPYSFTYVIIRDQGTNKEYLMVNGTQPVPLR
jgi:hypothetical protein